MAWSPITLYLIPLMDSNGDPYSGAVLKAYQSGTTTAIQMATNSTGSVLVDEVDINAAGFPEVSGNIIIPHVDQTYKLVLYPTQAAATAENSAIYTLDGLTPTGISADQVTTIATLTGLRNYTGAATTVVLEGASGSGDGAAGIYHYNSGSPAGTYSDNGTSIIVPTGGDGSEAWLLVKMANISVTQPFTTIELGHATDTTLSRDSAGVLAVEGVVVPTISSTSTLTNKTLTSPTINTPTITTPILTIPTTTLTSGGTTGVDYDVVWPTLVTGNVYTARLHATNIGPYEINTISVLRPDGETSNAMDAGEGEVMSYLYDSSGPSLTQLRISEKPIFITALLSPTADATKDFGRICRITLNALFDKATVRFRANYDAEGNYAEYLIIARQAAALNNDPVCHIECVDFNNKRATGATFTTDVLDITNVRAFYTISATESYIDVYLSSLNNNDIPFVYQFTFVQLYATAQFEAFNEETPIAALAWDDTSQASNGLVVYDSNLTLDSGFTSGSVRLTVKRALGGYWCKYYGRGSHNSATSAASTALIPSAYRPAYTVRSATGAGTVVGESVTTTSGNIQIINYDQSGSATSVTGVNVQLSNYWFVSD